jgi:hypothetical protein
VFASLTQDPRVINTALVVIAIYCGVNLILAISWAVKIYISRRQRERREMYAFFDRVYSQKPRDKHDQHSDQ